MKNNLTHLLTHLLIRCGVIALLSAVSTAAMADALNDPTRPPLLSRPATKTSATTASPAATRLTAVLYSDSRRVAVIDGRVLREGDHLGDAVVTRITNDSVTLTKAGRAEVMHLPKVTLQVKSSSAMENRP